MFPSQAPTVLLSNYQRRELLNVYANNFNAAGCTKGNFFLFLKLLRFFGCDALTRGERNSTFKAALLARIQADEVPAGA